MAAATVVQQSSLPVNFTSLRPPKRRSKKSSYDPALSPLYSARLLGRDELGDHSSTPAPQIYSLTTHLATYPLYETPSSTPDPSQAKRKQFGKLVGRRSHDRERSYAVANESSTPMDSTDSEAPAPRAKHRRSLSKDKYMKTIPRRFRDKDDTSTLDLSLSIEENEKRVGVAISSQTQSPETIRDVDSQFDRSKRHTRSWSANAIEGSDVNLFAPKMDFFQPIKVESRPGSPLTNRHSFTELEWKLCPDAVDPKMAGLGIDPGPEPRQRASTFDVSGSATHGSRSQGGTPSSRTNTWDSVTSAPAMQTTRPRFKSRLSNGSGSASQTTLASTKHGRLRRSTNQSFDSTAVASPLTRTSIDRPFSFKRGFSVNSRELSEVDRQAAVDLAREQFKQKQHAKTRRYDEQEKKAQERKDRRAHDQQERSRRQSDISASSRPKSASRIRELSFKDTPPEQREMPKASTWSGPRPRETSLDGVKFERTKRPNRKAKSTGSSTGFFTWCKTRLFHLR